MLPALISSNCAAGFGCLTDRLRRRYMIASPSDIRWTDVVQALVGLGGIPFIIYQLREVKRSVQGQTLSELYDHYHQVVSVFLEKPNLRPYFYENKALDTSADPALCVEVESMCELFAAVLEHAVVQEKNVPRRAWAECWQTFVTERLQKSSVLQEYLKKNEGWYLKTLPSPSPRLKAALTKPAGRFFSFLWPSRNSAEN